MSEKTFHLHFAVMQTSLTRVSGPRVLGHRRAAAGALLRPKVLPRDRALRQGNAH